MQNLKASAIFALSIFVVFCQKDINKDNDLCQHVFFEEEHGTLICKRICNPIPSAICFKARNIECCMAPAKPTPEPKIQECKDDSIKIIFIVTFLALFLLLTIFFGCILCILRSKRPDALYMKSMNLLKLNRPVHNPEPADQNELEPLGVPAEN